MKKIWVSIVEDQNVLATAFKSLLSAEKDIKVLDYYKNGEDFIMAIKHEKRKPDVVLMDIELPGQDGIETTKELKKLIPETKVIILTQYQDEDFIYTLMKLGVEGYLFKTIDSDKIVEAIRKVYNEHPQYDEYVNRVVLNDFKKERQAKNSLVLKNNILSARELDVLPYIAKGMKYEEIAGILNISVRTVETHRRNILKKLKLKNTRELVSYAYENRLVLK
jgi:DNA-binding NarL/FixJ family response regulator